MSQLLEGLALLKQTKVELSSKVVHWGDFPGGPLAKTSLSQ